MQALINARVRLDTAAGLRREGKGFLESFRLAGTVDDATIKEGMIAAAAECGTALPSVVMDAVSGNLAAAIDWGAIWAKIKEWLNSPEGQAILAALVRALVLMLIGA